MTVVSDASPLHYLVLIKAEHVLAQLFSEVVVPPAVLRELSHERAPERVRHWASDPPQWLRAECVVSHPTGALRHSRFRRFRSRSARRLSRRSSIFRIAA